MKNEVPKIKVKKKKKRKGKSFKASVEPKVTVYCIAYWNSIRKVLSADVEITNRTSMNDIFDVDARITGISGSSVTAFSPDSTVSGKSFWYYGKIAKGKKNIVYWEFHDPDSHFHSIQDKYAHRNWDTGFLQIIPHPAWYDDWTDPRNKNASRVTEIKTKNISNSLYN